MTEPHESLTAERRSPDARTPDARPGRPRRRAGMAVLALLAVLAAAYTIYWYVAAGELRSAAERWREERRALGETVTWQDFAVGGFPFWLRATVTAPQWARQDAAPWSWEAARVAARVRPWRFGRVELDLAGDHRFAWTDGARRLAYRGTAESLAALLEIEAGRPTAATFDLRGLRLDGGGELGVLRLDEATGSLRRPAVPPADHLVAGWTVAFDGSGIALPAPPVLPALPLGQQVTRVVLDASILGAIPPGPLDAGLARWRDDGGTVEVRHIRLDWGPLSIQGDGTLALDAALQPLGAFSARAQGFFEAIYILRKQGQVDSQAANTARLVLGVMSRPSPGGGAPTIALPVSIQNRTVFAGPVAVARLNPIVWTGAMPVF